MSDLCIFWICSFGSRRRRLTTKDPRERKKLISSPFTVARDGNVSKKKKRRFLSFDVWGKMSCKATLLLDVTFLVSKTFLRKNGSANVTSNVGNLLVSDHHFLGD